MSSSMLHFPQVHKELCDRLAEYMVFCDFAPQIQLYSYRRLSIGSARAAQKD